MAGLGGAGEEEDEEESAGEAELCWGGSAEAGLAEGEELGCSLNSLPNLRSSSSWDLCWNEGALLLLPSCGLDRLSVRSLAAALRISFTSTGKSGVGPAGLVEVVVVVTVGGVDSKKEEPPRWRSCGAVSDFGTRETAGEDWELGVRRVLVL